MTITCSTYLSYYHESTVTVLMWRPATQKTMTRQSNLVRLINSYNAEIFLYKSWRPKGFSRFEIIRNVSVSSFCFIWIPMLWVYGHYKLFNSFSAGTDFRRQNLTSKDVRFWRLKTVPALKGLLCLAGLSIICQWDYNAKSRPRTDLKSDRLKSDWYTKETKMKSFQNVCYFDAMKKHIYYITWYNGNVYFPCDEM